MFKRAVVGLLALLLTPCLPLTARADTLDSFTVVGGGLDIALSLPTSTTLPIAFLTGQFQPGPVAGTVNGVSESISTNFLYGTGCAVCSTLLLHFDSQTLFIGLPSLWQVTSPAAGLETFSFLAGTYNAPSQSPSGGPVYTINITPQASAVTPEPPPLVLVCTAVLAGGALLRRRELRRT